MRVEDIRMLCIGVLCLVGGVLLFYFGYFVYPEYFLAFTGLGGPLAWGLPLLLIFLGTGIIWATLKG